jgi:tetratricopeptide (TPR) repeat protein
MKKIFHITGFLFVFACGLFSQQNTTERINAYGLYYSGSFHEAIIEFNKIESVSMDLMPADRLILGISEFKIGNFTQALKDLQISSENGITDANLWLARIHATNNNSKDAVFYIERYLKTSALPDIELLREDSLFKDLRNSREWYSLMQTDWVTENQKVIEEAEDFLNNNNFEMAHQVISSKIPIVANKADLFAFNSKIYSREGNPRLALSEIVEALVLDPENTKYLKLKADYLLQLSDNSQALNELSNVIAKDPVDFEARFTRSKAAREAGNFELAIKDINLYLKYFNTDEALYLAGQVYYASEKYFDALRYYNRLIKDSKADAGYFKGRGMTYYQTGTFQLAAYDLSMSLDLKPDDPETNFYLGLAEYYKGNDNHACYYFKRARNLGELKAIEYIQKYCKGQ